MRNTDLVNYVAVTTNGSSLTGRSIPAKVRFAVNKVRSSKLLSKRFGTVEWVTLPRPMTKAEAVTYILTEKNTINMSDVAVKAAVEHSASRLINQK